VVTQEVLYHSKSLAIHPLLTDVFFQSVGRHVLAASEDGSVYCYSLKSGKFKRKFEGHNGAVTCLCVTEYSNSSMNSELEAAEQLSPDSFFSGSLDGQLRSFGFKVRDTFCCLRS
jgi:WD40 repeat protein